MWTGSSGPYRPAQPGQSPHAAWTMGVGARPVHQNNPSQGPAAYLDPRVRHPHQQHPSPQPPQQPQPPQPHPPPTPSQDGSADGLPEPPTSFPELEAMPLKDLRVLHEERAKFEDFVSKHKYQKVVDDFVARIRADVERFQREHDAITEKIDEKVDEQGLADLREKIDALGEEAKGLQKLKDEWMEHNAPERLIERLRVAIVESETISEGLQKSMLSSSMNFDEFLAQYITCRKKYHERNIKLEQLKKEGRKRSMGR